MKRIFAHLKLAAAMLALTALATACGGNDTPAVGGYTRQRSLTADERQLFEQIVDIDGTTYKPRSVATQVVAGTNYRFVCKARDDAGKRFDAVIVIYKPLPGQGEPRVTSIERSAR